MTTKRKWGFSNDAAEKIWTDSIGNNVYTRHRDECMRCKFAYKLREAAKAFLLSPRITTIQYHRTMEAISKRFPDCPEGARIYEVMMNDVMARIEESEANGN